MKIKEMLKQAIQLQDKLNSKIDKNWKENRTLRDFQIAIIQEVAELIDSYSWKWWKKMEDNEFNKKVELIDIFHFLLSQAILYKLYYDFDIIENVIKCYDDYLDIRDKLKYRDDFDLILLFLKFVISDKEPEFYHFFNIVNRHFNSLEEFLKWYFVKNVLNEIRQLKGYKTGEYKKVVDGMEDNEIIYKLAENIEFTDLEEFKNVLVDRYIAYITSFRVNYYE